MPTIKCELTVTDYQFQTFELLRGGVEERQFLSYVFQLGMADLMEDAARITKDDILQAQAANTQHFRRLKKMCAPVIDLVQSASDEALPTPLRRTPTG